MSVSKAGLIVTYVHRITGTMSHVGILVGKVFFGGFSTATQGDPKVG